MKLWLIVSQSMFQKVEIPKSRRRSHTLKVIFFSTWRKTCDSVCAIMKITAFSQEKHQ